MRGADSNFRRAAAALSAAQIAAFPAFCLDAPPRRCAKSRDFLSPLSVCVWVRARAGSAFADKSREEAPEDGLVRVRAWVEIWVKVGARFLI